PAIQIDEFGVNQIDDTVYAQNLFLKFAGVTDTKKIKLGIKESDKLIEYITLKAYVFPYINLVWMGLVIMAIGIIMSAVKRAKLSTFYASLALILAGSGLIYMFLLAN
ncbi:MAG TPA: hypothetical protein PK987_10675, partial [Ferruginibacter sp.]|nr:hypothetical protein [Ferruginibacter sp.]